LNGIEYNLIKRYLICIIIIFILDYIKLNGIEYNLIKRYLICIICNYIELILIIYLSYILFTQLSNIENFIISYTITYIFCFLAVIYDIYNILIIGDIS
jgi:hypothetical protein